MAPVAWTLQSQIPPLPHTAPAGASSPPAGYAAPLDHPPHPPSRKRRRESAGVKPRDWGTAGLGANTIHPGGSSTRRPTASSPGPPGPRGNELERFGGRGVSPQTFPRPPFLQRAVILALQKQILVLQKKILALRRERAAAPGTPLGMATFSSLPAKRSAGALAATRSRASRARVADLDDSGGPIDNPDGNNPEKKRD